MVGKTISHYRILEKLGEGGMGIVYKAEDIRLKRAAALKFLSPKVLPDESDRERLVREAQAAAALDHPNICTVYEIDEADGQSFMVMAWVQGQDLSARIEEGPLDPEEALSIAIQVARGLEEAHEKGIIHRDVKPANIMVTPKGQVKIMDFGLAEVFEPVAARCDEPASGTVAYMSPEQLSAERADHRSDIWALGVVLYEMLSGRRPFEGKYELEVMYDILNAEPEPITRVRRGLPVQFERVLAKSLAKNPEERYQTVGKMLADLEALGRIPEPAGPPRRPIAVISFENLTGDRAYDYLERAIPNLLITSLEQSEYLQVTTWERMQDLVRQLGREAAGIVDRELGFELCRLEGIGAVVVGSFTKAGDVFATDAKILDVETRRLLKSASSKGEGIGSILENQIDELSEEISRSLGVPDHRADRGELPIADVATTLMDAYEYFLRGRDSYEKLYNDDARKLLEKALELDPTFAAANLYLAWTYSRLRETKKRDRAFERAKRLSEKATHRERLYIEAAYARAIEQDSDKEVRILKEIAQAYPWEKRVHHRLAGYYRRKNLLYQAIEEYNRALELDPHFGWAMNELAYMYADIEDFAKASEYFERYASVSPGDANPIDSIGELCFRMGKPDEAIAKYKEALGIRPDFYYAYWEIAYVCALKEDMAEAVRWIDTFIDKAPSFGTRTEGHRWRCLFRHWMGDVGGALAEAGKMTELAEEEESVLWRAEAERMKGWIHYERMDLVSSRKCFESCIEAIDSDPAEFIPQATSYSSGSLEQIPKLAAVHTFSLALVSLKEGRVDLARSMLTEVAPLLPDHAVLLEGELLLAEASADEAIAVCEKAPPWKIPYMSDTEGMLTYNLPPHKDVLARAYRLKGDLERAIAVYERLVTVDPDERDRRLPHPDYRLRLAELHEEQGSPEKAIEQYERYLGIRRQADPRLPEMTVAMARLAALTGRRG